MKKQLLLFTLLTSNTLLTEVSASGDNPLYSLEIEQLMSVPVQIATKTDTPLKYTPSTVSYFTMQDLKQLGVKNLVELFTHIPGFYSMYNSVEGNQSYLIARGHPQKYANTLLVLLNGQRLNDDYTGGVNYITRFLSLHNVERIEVNRGPGSALYGSNAFNGVINIITKLDNTISAAIGDIGQRELNLGVTTDIDGFTLGAGFHYYQDDGDTLKPIFDRFALQNSTSDPHSATQLELNLQYDKIIWRNRYHRSQRDKHYLFRRVRDSVNTIKTENWLSRLEYQTGNENRWQLSTALEYNKAKRVSLGTLEVEGTGPFTNADFLFGENFNYESYRASVDYNYKISAVHSLTSGLEFVSSSVPGGFLRSNYDIFSDLSYLAQVQNFTRTEQRVIDDTKRRISMGYMQLESQWNENWRSTIGVRRDNYNDVSDKTNPRLSLIYELNEYHLFKLIYGQAYRVPSLGDLYDDESGLTLGNQTLKPTTITSYEAVYQYTGEQLFLVTSLYNNSISDLIDFGTDGENVFLDNVAHNDTTGIELEWNYKLASWLNIKGHLTHLLKNDTTVEPQQAATASAQLVPKTYGTLALQGSISDAWSAALVMNSRSNVPVLTQQGSLNTFNSTITYAFDSVTTATFSIRNLLNKRYATAAVIPLGQLNDKLFGEYPARGRTLQLSVEYRF
ncbi:TonB-dependent receptor plug domain-containing protein [Pseudoalteromonas sp. T1lg65]|uniref:TonB-dependent receptor plug domain-containing protein n=1 Tax=Pseudoalteromonas sp. T1lg65 TaxID=2077101 RepID=UPI003F791B08